MPPKSGGVKNVRLPRPPVGAVRAVRAPVGTVEGIDLFATADALVDVWDALIQSRARPVGRSIEEALRIETGFPRLGAELDSRTIVQEAGLENEATSFTKGCYLGQELVARIQSRGHVNRRLRGIVVGGSTIPPVGAEVFEAAAAAGGKDREEAGAALGAEKPVGALTSVSESIALAAPIALAYVRSEVEPPADVVLRWQGGEVGAEVRALPLLG